MFSMTAFATSSEETEKINRTLALEEAKEYLLNYCEIKTGPNGETYTTTLNFKTEEALNTAAEYIVDYGIDAYKEKLHAEIAAKMSQENPSGAIMPLQDHSKTVLPEAQRVYVSEDGTHTISGIGYGILGYDTLGAFEYTVKLSYKITVEDGVITKVSSLSVNFPYIGGGSKYDTSSITYYNNVTSAGATANYRFKKIVELPNNTELIQTASAYFAIFVYVQ